MAGFLKEKAVVLVVEDDGNLRKLVTRLIQAAGFDVLEAATADEAIEILERHAAVRIVFTDIDMPGSMNGIRLAAAVRGRWPPIEIIITSGRQRLRDVDLPPRGVFISKPYEGDRLVETLRVMAA